MLSFTGGMAVKFWGRLNIFSPLFFHYPSTYVSRFLTTSVRHPEFQRQPQDPDKRRLWLAYSAAHRGFGDDVAGLLFKRRFAHYTINLMSFDDSIQLRSNWMNSAATNHAGKKSSFSFHSRTRYRARDVLTCWPVEKLGRIQLTTVCGAFYRTC